MARKKVSRNDPCPCGSDKKFKHCCYGKGLDWSQPLAPRPRRVTPPPPPEAGLAFLGAFAVVDHKLQALSQASPEEAAWKSVVQRLSETASLGERMRTYQAVREAGVIPKEAADFLVAHAIQWMPDLTLPVPPDTENAADEEMGRKLDEATLVMLRQHGGEELAWRFVTNCLEYDRRHERGRQFFFGPPDELLAERLRGKGVID